MNLLLKAVEVIAPKSSLNRQKTDILIEDGIITKIGTIDNIPENTQTIQKDNLKISIGWLDMRASFKDPGYEHKETLASGRKCAAKGGFTEVAVLPNTSPALDTKDSLAYIQQRNAYELVQLHPVASVSVKVKGEDLTEMIDLHHAGAVAFSDGHMPVWHSDIMVKSLMYLQKFDGLLINRPEDTLLTRFGVMNEGITSTQLGLKGMPALAEEMMIRRDLDFLAYTGGKVHFSCISSAKSVALIRQAKQEGFQVTCDIAAHQIAFDDSFLMDFDTNFKVNPPFRTQNDVQALWDGLKDGTIDVIVSDHNPQDTESKALEFDLADFGVIGLETAYASVITNNTGLDLENIIDKLAYAPRLILKKDIPQIAESQKANLTLFDDTSVYTYQMENIVSESKNSPFLNKTLKGKIWGVINNGKAELFI